MAEQPPAPQVGPAMWGGLRWPERVVSTTTASRARSLPAGLVETLVSLLLVILGAVALTVGAGLLWGAGGALLVGGAIMLGIGILLGVSRS